MQVHLGPCSVHCVVASALLAGPLVAQAPFPLEAGEIVATYCPNGTGSTAYSVILVDPRSPGPIGSNWNAPFFSNASGPPTEVWNVPNLGHVFGIAVDNWPSIYVTATTAYGPAPVTQFGPGGGGGVYRIDGQTGNIDNWMVTGTVAIFDNKLVNDAPPGVTPPGLGDICYDEVYDQFFVSNFRDGRIYQVKHVGNIGEVQAVYDPFHAYPYDANDDPSFPTDPTFAPLGERVWAVHVTEVPKASRSLGPPPLKRALLFSVWLRDQSRPDTSWPSTWPFHFGPNNNAIFAWYLDAQGNPESTGPRLFKVMPYLDTLTYSNPVSDITSYGKYLYFAERTMDDDYGKLGEIGHHSRMLVYKRVPTPTAFTFPPSPPPTNSYHYSYKIGDWDSPRGWNSAGGVAVWRPLPLPFNSRVMRCAAMVQGTTSMGCKGSPAEATSS